MQVHTTQRVHCVICIAWRLAARPTSSTLRCDCPITVSHLMLFHSISEGFTDLLSQRVIIDKFGSEGTRLGAQSSTHHFLKRMDLGRDLI